MTAAGRKRSVSRQGAPQKATALTLCSLFRDFQFHDFVADVGHADLQPLMNWTAMRPRVVERARDYVIGILKTLPRHAEPFHSMTSHWRWLEVSHQPFNNSNAIVGPGLRQLRVLTECGDRRRAGPQNRQAEEVKDERGTCSGVPLRPARKRLAVRNEHTADSNQIRPNAGKVHAL